MKLIAINYIITLIQYKVIISSLITGGVPSVSAPETDKKNFTTAVALAVPHCRDGMSSAGGCGDSAYRDHPEETDEKLAACYDLAYQMKNPYIYRPSPTPLALSDYTINFLWVNLNPQDRIADIAQNIFKDGLDLSENAG